MHLDLLSWDLPMHPGPSKTHRRDVEGGVGVWNVRRLWRLAEALPAKAVPVAELRAEYEQVYWFGGSVQPTVEAVVEHTRRILDVEFDHPIILSQSGVVMDGMHRLAKALLLGHPTVQAVRFDVDPAPDRIEAVE